MDGQTPPVLPRVFLLPSCPLSALLFTVLMKTSFCLIRPKVGRACDSGSWLQDTCVRGKRALSPSVGSAVVCMDIPSLDRSTYCSVRWLTPFRWVLSFSVTRRKSDSASGPRHEAGAHTARVWGLVRKGSLQPSTEARAASELSAPVSF